MGRNMDREFIASELSVATLLSLSQIHSKGVLWASSGRVLAQVMISSKAINPNSEIKMEMTGNTLERLITLDFVMQDDRGRYRLKDGVVEHNLVSRDCDVCALFSRTRPALFDAQTQTGKWGYVCAEHFVTEGCYLGLGRGQVLAGR